MDGGISGEKIYGNLLINIPKYGMLLNGGATFTPAET